MVMILGLFMTANVISTDVDAAGFSKRTTAPDSTNSYYYSGNNPFYSTYVGQCTWYAWGRAYEILGSRPNLSTRGSGAWYDANKSSGAYSYGSMPKVGAVACWSNHVAIVEEVDSNGVGITVSEYWGSTDLSFHLSHYASGSAYNYGGNVFYGYIYIYNGTVSYDPVGYLDGADSPEPGKLHVAGWAFDRDDVNASLKIHIYVGGVFAGEISAWKGRADVNGSFPGIGDYHGFEEVIEISQSGNQTVDVYAINVGGGSNIHIGSATVTIAAKPTDTEPPTISDVVVSQITSKGYRVTCKVNDNVGVTSVKFPTWTSTNTPIWLDGTINGNVATCYINVSDFSNNNGEWATHIYAYDAAGNYSSDSVSPGYHYTTDEPLAVYSTVYNGHKYIVYNSGKTWTEAKQWCEQNGGYLATATTEGEWNAIKGILEKYKGVNSWLGAENTSGSWKWLSGESMNYNVWGKNQPDNNEGVEHYLGTWGKWYGYINGYFWNDYVNSPYDVGGFVMEKEIVPTATAEFNGNKYEYYSDTMSWWQAYRFCEKKGGHLVTINSKEENDFVVGMTTGKNYGVWTGGKTDSSHEVWYWITGEPFEYQNWDDGEPNNVNQDAVQLYITDTHIGKWDDLASTDTTNCGFVCEYDNSIDASKYEPVYKENYNGHEYWFFENTVDWKTAKKICEAKGGHLVIIENDSENSFVYSGLQKMSQSEAWIGASDVEQEGLWIDVKGNPINYTKWDTSQPDNWNGSCEEDYALIWRDGNWNDANSVGAIISGVGFICEFDDLCTGSGHSYTTKVVEPTCTEQGYTLHTCSKCGDSYKDNVTNKLSHKFGEWSVTGDKAVHKCTLCGAEETKPLASSVTLDKTSVSIEKGKNITLKAIISPDDAFDKTVTWSSTNSNVATVSDGVVTAKSAGTAVIIAVTSNGKTATCTVTVTDKTISNLNNTSVVSSDIYQVGDKVRIAPSANGGTGEYSSAVYYKRSTASTWRVLGKEFANTFKQSSSTVAFQPTSAGSFDIKVVIKDTDGSAAEQFFTVEVVDELELTNISIVGRYVVKLGTAIPMIGKAVGGAGSYTYSFYFKRSTNTNWKLLGEKFQTAASARFKPTATGTYDIRIDVKDSSGTIVKKFFTATAR